MRISSILKIVQDSQPYFFSPVCPSLRSQKCTPRSLTPEQINTVLRVGLSVLGVSFPLERLRFFRGELLTATFCIAPLQRWQLRKVAFAKPQPGNARQKFIATTYKSYLLSLYNNVMAFNSISRSDINHRPYPDPSVKPVLHRTVHSVMISFLPESSNIWI